MLDKNVTEKSTAQAVLSALSSALAPVAAVALRVGLTSQEIEDAVRRMLVAAAARDSVRERGKVVVSAVALRCGLDRAEVRRILKAEACTEQRDGPDTHRLNRVIEGWRFDPDFTETAAKPRRLEQAGECSFTSLVQRYAPSLYPPTVLGELLRVGVITRAVDGSVDLHATEYLPMSLDLHSIQELGARSSEVLAALVDRAVSPGRRTFVTEAVGVNVSAEFIPGLRRKLRERTESFVKLVDEELNAPGVQCPDAKGRRIGIVVVEIGSPDSSPSHVGELDEDTVEFGLIGRRTK